MTSYGFGTGTSTFTGYGICCNGKFMYFIESSVVNYYKIAISIENGVKTDLDHFVRLRNRYFHFVWNLVARDRANFLILLSCVPLLTDMFCSTHLFDDLVWFWYVNFHLVWFIDGNFNLVWDLQQRFSKKLINISRTSKYFF